MSRSRSRTLTPCVGLAALCWPACAAAANPEPLTLEDALRNASMQDETVLAAGETLEVARAGVADATANLLPTVEVSAAQAFGSGVQDRIDGTYAEKPSYRRAELEVRVPLLDLDEVGGVVAAKRERRAAAARQEMTRDQALYAVARAYQEALSAQAAVESARASVDSAVALERATRIRVDSGDEIQLELDRVRADRVVAEGKAQQAAFAAEVAVVRLAYAANLPAEEYELIPPQRTTIPIPDTDSLDGLAGLGRADLRCSHWTFEAARARRRAAGLELVPDINLELNGRYTDIRDDRDPERWRVMLVASWTLPGLIDTPAKMKRARAVERRAELDVRRLQREIDLSVRTAEIHLAAAQAAVVVAEEHASIASDNLAAGMALYEGGLATGLQLTTLRASRDGAVADLQEALLTRDLAEVDLLEELGVDPLEAFAGPR